MKWRGGDLHLAGNNEPKRDIATFLNILQRE
jgi:hypothetical protein